MCPRTERCVPSPNCDGFGVFRKGGERNSDVVRVRKDFPTLIIITAPLDYTSGSCFSKPTRKDSTRTH